MADETTYSERDIREMRSEAGAAVRKAQELIDKAKAESRGFSDDEQSQFDGLHNQAEALRAQADQAQSMLDAEMRQVQWGSPPPKPESRAAVEQAEERTHLYPDWSDPEDEQRHREAFLYAMQYGHSELPESEARFLARKRRQNRHEMPPQIRLRMSQLSQLQNPAEERALGSLATNLGAEAVPQGFLDELVDETTQLVGGVRATRARVIRTISGEDLIVPKQTGTATGEIIGENAAHNEADPATASVTMNAWTYSSKIVRVAVQFLQDTGVSDFEAWLRSELAGRIGRAQNGHFTSGTGTSQPTGVDTATAVAGTATISWANWLTLKAGLEAGYWSPSTSQVMMSPDAFTDFQGVLGSDNHPLFQQDPTRQNIGTIDGYPIILNSDLANGGAAKSVVFGDFRQGYGIRDAGSVAVLRSVERYFEYLQVAFLAYWRSDGQLLNDNALVVNAV